LREKLIDRVPAEEIALQGREVAARQRDPYSVIHEWLEKY